MGFKIRYFLKQWKYICIIFSKHKPKLQLWVYLKTDHHSLDWFYIILLWTFPIRVGSELDACFILCHKCTSTHCHGPWLSYILGKYTIHIYLFIYSFIPRYNRHLNWKATYMLDSNIKFIMTQCNDQKIKNHNIFKILF